MQLNNYVDVATRLSRALERWPDLRIHEHLPEVVTIDGHHFVQVTVTVHRDPDDPAPAVATAWEPWPGKSNFTRDSEMMNCATSALGRALGYMGVASNASIATVEEVANRVRDREAAPNATTASKAQLGQIAALLEELGIADRTEKLDFVSAIVDRELGSSRELSKVEASKVIGDLTARKAAL